MHLTTSVCFRQRCAPTGFYPTTMSFKIATPFLKNPEKLSPLRGSLSPPPSAHKTVRSSGRGARGISDRDWLGCIIVPSHLFSPYRIRSQFIRHSFLSSSPSSSDSVSVRLPVHDDNVRSQMIRRSRPRTFFCFSAFLVNLSLPQAHCHTPLSLSHSHFPRLNSLKTVRVPTNFSEKGDLPYNQLCYEHHLSMSDLLNSCPRAKHHRVLPPAALRDYAFT